MKRFLTAAMAIGLCATISASFSATLSAKTVASNQVENGGPGPYKAEIVKDNGLDGYTIFKPVDLKSASAVEGPLPVILFCNGGCSRDTRGFYAFLTNIASRGYVIISNGIWPEPVDKSKTTADKSKATADKTEEASAAPAPQPKSPEEERKAMMEGFRKAEAQNVADAKDYLRALNYLERQSADKKSEYYQTIDTKNVASMGMSCGGGQALVLGTCGDKRIHTTLALNSGVAYLDDGDTWMVSKEELEYLGGPILYLTGGKDDVAYANAADDFSRITKVPVAIGNLPVGHGGTYSNEHGGSFADMSILWLDLYLKGKTENEVVFKYLELPAYLKEEGWTLHSKNYSEPIEMKLWSDAELAQADSKEVSGKNDFGEVTYYSGVTVPGMEVYLPDKDKANGTGILIFPGGGLMSLTWDTEAREVAKYLNARGIAAMVIKYRLRTGRGMARPASGEVPDNKFLRMEGQIFDFAELNKANTNPSVPDPSDKSIDNAADDANRAFEIVKAHAAEWGLDPARIGFLGFSAGGGVELAALMKADKEHVPAFVGTVYGPSLVDIDVPENAPDLYIAVHAGHPNVAAGCMALFMEWKKAGANAEIHVYDKPTGNFYGMRGSGEYNVHGGSWLDPFYNWLSAKGFVKR